MNGEENCYCPGYLIYSSLDERFGSISFPMISDEVSDLEDSQTSLPFSPRLSDLTT